MGNTLGEVSDLLAPQPAGTRQLRPSALGRFISYDQCHRLFRLDLYDRPIHDELYRLTGTSPELLSPALSESGEQWEHEVGDALLAAGWFVRDLSNDRKPDLLRAWQLADTTPVIVLQSEVQASIGGWQITARPDLVLIDKSIEAKPPRLLVADLKSSRSVKLDHRMQVAIYAMLMRQLIPNAEITQAIIYREPVEPKSMWSAELLSHRQAAIEILRMESGGLLAIADRPERYIEQVERTIFAPGSLANRIAESPFLDLPFHLDSKCDGCEYNQVCLHCARESSDLSLIPYMNERSKRLLRAKQITTIDDLRNLAATDAGRYLALQVTPSLGHRLGEFMQRAESYQRWLNREKVELRLPGPGYSSLPASSAEFHPNLIRVFVDIQRDLSSGRVYLLGALVSCLANGQEDSTREATVVKLAGISVEDDRTEAALAQEWIRDVLLAVKTMMSPDATGKLSAPVHFYVWDQAQVTALQDLVNRHGHSVIGIEAVMALMMQAAAFDSMNLSTVANEVQAQLSLPMLCQSLQSVSIYLGFDWPVEIRQRFRYHLFDAVGREDDREGAQLVPVRSRFRSEIPTEYVRRAWGSDGGHADIDSDDERSPRRSWTLYGTPTLAQIEELQTLRLKSLQHIAGRLRTNRQTAKSVFDLGVLSRLKYRPEKPIEAIREFVATERHLDLGQWRKIHALDIDSRVKLGETLIVRYRDVDQPTDVRMAMRDAREKQAARDSLGDKYRDLSSKAKKAYGYSLADAEVVLNIDPSDLPIPLTEVLLLSNRRVGDFVVISPASSVNRPADTELREPYQTTFKQIMTMGTRAVIARRTEDGELTVRLRGGGKGIDGFVWGPSPRPFADGEVLTIDADPDSWPANRQWSVIESIRSGQPHAGYAWIAGVAADMPDWSDAESDAQWRFMEGLLHLGEIGPDASRYEIAKQDFIGRYGDAPMMLVQGPPGTGKSTTTGWAVWSRIQAALASGREFRVAVGCKTHSATDVLIGAVISARDRLNAIAIQYPDYFDRYFHRDLLTIPVFRFEPKSAANAPAGSRAFATKSTVARLNELRKWNQVVVGATTLGVGKLATRAWRDGDSVWDLLILDEASQMAVPDFLVASVGLKQDGRTIVVGDHRQMPPIARQNWEEGEVQALDPFAMYRSLFDVVRFSEQPRIDIKFEESFRVHRDVAEYLRREVYVADGIDFHSRRTTVASLAAADSFANAVISAPHPLILVIHSEAESQQRNLLEQTLSGRILTSIQSLGEDKAVGVVVPHRAQRADLRKQILRWTGDDVLADSVDTVERFQGDERQIIIYSATESDPAYLRDTGSFLFDPRRLTVAISRAKAKLVVIASESIFEFLPTDETSLVNSAIWRNLRDKTCTIEVWAGEVEGHRVTVWANPPLGTDRKPV